MRLLCDPNIDHGYLDAFRRAEGITVMNVETVLSADASDPEIIAYAEEHDWVGNYRGHTTTYSVK